MKKATEKINVIVPIYKGRDYIYNIIHMLEDNWNYLKRIKPLTIELILINDYPAEKIEIREEWIKNISWKLIINKKNQGIHFSRVEGFLQSDGEFILFLDQDDEISPIYLQEQLNVLDEYDAVICNGKNEGKLIYKNNTELNKAIDINEYKNGYNRIVSPGQVILRRNVIPNEWLNNILLQNGADDYFLWMLMFYNNCKFKIYDKVLFWHKISGENTSRDWIKINNSVFEMVEKLIDLRYLNNEEGEKIRSNRLRIINKKEVSMEEFEKVLGYKKILDFWMGLRDEKISVSIFLNKMNLKRIAIYGAGNLGKHLYYELLESNIQVSCFLDTNKDSEIIGMKTYKPGEVITPVDAIIVTPFLEFQKIKNQLIKSYSYDIVSLEVLILNADCNLEIE